MEVDPLEKLDTVDKEILILKRSSPKLSLEAIGKLLKNPISKQRVHQRMNRDRFKRVWQLLDNDVITIMKQAQITALYVLLENLKSPDKKLAVSCAKFLLQPIIEKCDALLPESLEGLEELEFITTEGDNEDTDKD